MSIKPLPEDVIRRIRSSATITSLNGVVCGLIRNSLDAGATRINITVDYSRGNCTVEDDGRGILPLEFREVGGLGKLYHTSRRSPENECHGSNGSFLASLAALALLSITSHHHLHNSQNSLIIHTSRVLARNIPALPEQCLHTFSHGTRVIVRDLFGSMAVRVKQRAVASEKAAVDKEWCRLVYSATALLLAWPSSVALVVRDTVQNNEKRFKPNILPRPIAKADFASRSSLILAQSGLADSLDHASWIPIGASVGNLTINGCISLRPVATRRAQFISLGIHPTTDEYRTNVLYSEVNRVFLNSGFAVEEEVAICRGDSATILASREMGDRNSRPKRGLDRWPMFYFRINSSSEEQPGLATSFEDLLEDRSRTLTDVVDLLKLVCYEFLKKHHLRPHKVATSLKRSSSQKPEGDNSGTDTVKKGARRSKTPSLGTSRPSSATSVSRPNSPFDLWQRVKVGRAPGDYGKSGIPTPGSSGACPANKDDSMVKEAVGETYIPPSLRFLDSSGNVMRRPFGDLPSPSPLKASGEMDTQRSAVASGMTGTDLASESESTCFPWPPETNKSEKSLGSSKPASIELSSAFKRFKETSTELKDEPSDWLRAILAKWENPVFQPVEPPVPRINEGIFEGSDLIANSALESDSTGCRHDTHTSSVKLSGRISKAALLCSQVVSQVDRKFILVKLGQEKLDIKPLPGQESSVLVLIDQHAADERCRLEELMKDYFWIPEGSDSVVARTQPLEKPLQFEFSNKEYGLLRMHANHLHQWGVMYKLEEPEVYYWRQKSKQLPKVEVVSLPPSILERCRMEPRLIAELLRNEIWKVEEEGKPTARSYTLENWVSNFHGCPQGILDLLNSRSCRSAIMFNDQLSKDECEALVQRLSLCAFPFQCAHGRPSMVPLIDTRSLGTSLEPSLGSFGSRLRKSGWIG